MTPAERPCAKAALDQAVRAQRAAHKASEDGVRGVASLKEALEQLHGSFEGIAINIDDAVCFSVSDRKFILELIGDQSKINLYYIDLSLYMYIYIYICIYMYIYKYVYIYLLIELACGKVSLQAHRDGGGAKVRVRRSGCLVFSQGALLKVFCNKNDMFNRFSNDLWNFWG